MLKEVKEFKEAIDKQMKWYKKYHNGEEPKMYVLTTIKKAEHPRYYSSYHPTTCIRPCDMSYKKFYSLNNSAEGFRLNLDSAFFQVDFDKVDKAQFLLECTLLNIMPEVEFIDDEEGKAIDEIDLTTNKSFFDMRKKALERRKQCQRQ